MYAACVAQDVTTENQLTPFFTVTHDQLKCGEDADHQQMCVTTDKMLSNF